jgi:hypothetical protein
MAIATTLINTANISTGDTISIASVDPGANELYLVFLAMRTVTITPSISGTGLSWTEVTSSGLTTAQSQTRMFIWRGLSSSDPSSGTVTVTFTGNTKSAVLAIVKVTGMDTTGTNGSGAIDTFGTNAGPAVTNDTNMLCAVTTLTATTRVIGFGTHRNTTFTVPSGQTSISINNKNTDTSANTTTGMKMKQQLE